MPNNHYMSYPAYLHTWKSHMYIKWYICRGHVLISPPPVKPEDYRFALCPSVCPSVRHSRFSRLFFAMLWHIWMKVGSKLPYEELQIKFDFHHGWPTFSWVNCHLFKICFPDFSRLCFHISEWKLVASFHMKNYRSSSTFITVDLLFHELIALFQNSFSGLFSAMLSHISMTLDKELPYEELQIKFDFRHGWPTFSWVIALCSKFVFRTFLADTKVHQNNGCRFEFVGVGWGPVLL